MVERRCNATSLLVVAKNNASHEFLAKQFEEKTVHRIYEALVYGKMNLLSGSIESYLVRHKNDRKKFCSEDISRGSIREHKGKFAKTHYRTLKQSPSKLTLLEFKLETGRTHQIRVHTTEMTHPIVGDNIYGSLARSKQLKSVKLRKHIENLDRFALHAKELGFIHPTTGKMMRFNSEIPQDMVACLEKWRTYTVNQKE